MFRSMGDNLKLSASKANKCYVPVSGARVETVRSSNPASQDGPRACWTLSWPRLVHCRWGDGEGNLDQLSLFIFLSLKVFQMVENPAEMETRSF